MKELINKNRQKIQQIIKKFTGEYNEDLEQEVYIKTYLNLSKYIEQNKFSKWICTITANLCRDYLRSAKFKNSKNTISDNETYISIKSDSTTEKEYSKKERQKLILKEIDKLPKKLKDVLILYEFEDYSYEKIASKFHIPIGTVKSRLNSARKILKEKLYFLISDEEI